MVRLEFLDHPDEDLKILHQIDPLYVPIGRDLYFWQAERHKIKTFVDGKTGKRLIGHELMCQAGSTRLPLSNASRNESIGP